MRRSGWREWIVAFGWSWAALAAAPVVRDIRVMTVDAVPINAEQVLAHISARVGAELDRAAVSEDLRALRRSGIYSYAEAQVEPQADGQVILILRVAGRPKIRNLTIEGAEYLGNKKVKSLMGISSGDRVDSAVLGEKAQKVREGYRKEFFPETKVEWTLTPLPDNPEFADVHIRVTEGQRAIVRRIRFPGAKHVRRRELLKVLRQKQSSWLTWITNDGVYEPASVLADREAVRKVFLDRGYLGATVAEPVFEYVSRKKMDITFPVTEGPLYRLRDWQIAGVTLFPTGEVTRGVLVPKKKTAALETIERNAQNIRDYYGSRGYIKTRVEPLIALDTNAAAATVTYQVQEGMLAYIKNIEIRGNAQTKDRVIRREISVAPGDIFNEVKVRSSENRIRNLNYFSYVNSYPESTAVSNRFNLIFDVEEQRTGQFMLGMGFSSVDNIIGFAELTQGNFDLFGWPHFTGGGQKLKLRVQAGSKRSDIEFSLIEPWFLNRRLSLGLDLFRHDSRFLSDRYDQTTTGGSLTLGQPLLTFNRLNWIYGLEDIEIRNVSTNASELIQMEGGGRLKSYGTVEIIRDTRNSPFVATRGFRGSAAATLAGGPFGGETDTYQLQLRASQFVPLWFDHVLNLRGWTSMIEEYGDTERVPLFDRLFVGGPRTVRAFRYRRVGPKDQSGEPIGGRSAAAITAEYTVPVAEKVRLAFFYDGGIVWEGIYQKGSIYVSEDEMDNIVGDGVYCDGYGLGIRFDFPQFPIQLDYAWPNRTDGRLSDKGRFSFFIGYTY